MPSLAGFVGIALYENQASWETRVSRAHVYQHKYQITIEVLGLQETRIRTSTTKVVFPIKKTSA
jgi:hypothetical protein